MSFDPLTVVFAIVAILVVWKLNSVLGQNTGFQRQRPPSPPQPGPNGREPQPRIADRRAQPVPGMRNVLRLPGSAPPASADPARWTAFLEPNATAAPGLEAIAAADPNFAPEPFLDGARTAYEAVVTAFAAGERRTLQNLLSREVYDGFGAAIAERERAGETLTTTFVSIEDPKFSDAALDGRTARVTVRFLSKQISATHGAGGQLRDGSPDRVCDVNDLWTFERDTRARDPNWKLVATQSGH